VYVPCTVYAVCINLLNECKAMCSTQRNKSAFHNRYVLNTSNGSRFSHARPCLFALYSSSAIRFRTCTWWLSCHAERLWFLLTNFSWLPANMYMRCYFRIFGWWLLFISIFLFLFYTVLLKILYSKFLQ